MAIILGAGSVHAQESAGLTSPLSPQLELTARLSEQLDVRFGLNRTSPHPDMRWQQGAAGDRLPGISATALVDWQFSPLGMRLTGGALYGDLGWSGLDPVWTRQGFNAYSLDGGLTQSPTHQVTPYLGLGWDQDFGSSGRIGLKLDMGVMFDSVGPTATSGPQRNPAEEAVLRQQFESFRYTPMFSAGLKYRF
ncbi:MAG TPA: hypothetical protein VKA32_00720 [Gammaproteobacteria bacterium]|nr:hypothetical protein [Gammaproteobacteria bacterium]